MPVIPTLGRLRLEDGEFEASLEYIANSILGSITRPRLQTNPSAGIESLHSTCPLTFSSLPTGSEFRDLNELRGPCALTFLLPDG